MTSSNEEPTSEWQQADLELSLLDGPTGAGTLNAEQDQPKASGRRSRKTSKVHFEEITGAPPPPERRSGKHYSWTSVEELQRRRNAKESARARLLPAHLRRSDEDVAREAMSNAFSRTCSHVVMPLCVAGALIAAASVVSFHRVAGTLPADVAIMLLVGTLLGGGILAMLSSWVAQLWYVAPFGTSAHSPEHP